MLKRSIKTTSLLLAATSIVSMIPAMATEYQKVDSQEGVIYDAQSKGGGIFVIDGEINGDEDRAIYLLKDGKYTKLEDAETGDTIGDICQGKYLEMTQSDGDVYYVDITTGKESDEYSREVENSEIARKLKNKIKKDNDGRFSSDSVDNLVTADTTVRGDGSGQETMWGITGSWRQYLYELKNPFAGVGGYSKKIDTIYSDPNGNYIDVDYSLGSIAVSITTGSSVTIKNTDDTYEVNENGKTYEIKAQIDNDRTWDEGPEYIVRTAKLTIWKKEKGAGDNTYVNATDKAKLGTKGHLYAQATNDDNSITVLQRISKAQASDTVDGIKYPKDVKTYFITDEDGKPESLLALGNGSGNAYTGYGLRAITGGTQGYNVSFFTDFANKRIYAETINYKSKSGYNYIDVDKYDQTDVEANGFKLGCGDVWALGDGYVKRFNDKENKFEKLYKVDSGMTNLHCSLPTDIVVWDENKEIYSVVYPKASAEEKKDTGVTENKTITTTETITSNTTAASKITEAPALSTKTGWIKNNDGTWTYIKADGTKATGWYQEGTTWYYLKANSTMATGWEKVGGVWYYLNGSGAMQTGWINDNGTWYYCDESGAMLANTSVGGYVLGSDGAWIK
jgi:hypothetical protein